ncbi:MAG: HU family DNA-binding protein, partial [Pyrinomonadaceae bacterium]
MIKSARRLFEGRNMTKAEIVAKVAESVDLNKKDVEKLVDMVFDEIISALNNGDKVELRGFGSFRTRVRRARKGRNPKTGKTI